MPPEPSLAGDLRRLLLRLREGPAAAIRIADLAAGAARGRVLFRRAHRDGRVYVGAGVTLDLRGEVALGRDVFLFGGMIPTEIVCHPGASLSIGAGTELNYGVSIEAHQRIRIGARCKIGSMVRIADVNACARHDGALPVTIGDDVWIAHGAVIEPGAVIGDGSVVSAGSVVASAIPPQTLAVGNPARGAARDGRRRQSLTHPLRRDAQSSFTKPLEPCDLAAISPIVPWPPSCLDRR
jgi:maltose O-acetyltransferase